ncbi:hypothetical protein BKG96_06690 [Rodentibacter caecimuris]|uniref:MobA/MobL protein domain-containing protein n=1 Tax=Rodentibacter caecimuris TaxID=1796644 RepID=A0A1V3KKQ2_9PAST|nr:MobA/MobL family protein [Rodentibacter heylii]OOF78175.1 hypothetical protein BKG96_06690 [Rodentibacter heylii]
MSLNHIHLQASVKSRKTHDNGKTTNAVGSSAYRHKNVFTDVLGRKFDYSHLNNEFVTGFLMMSEDIKNAILNNPTTNLFSRAFNQIRQDEKLSNQEKHAEASNHLWNLVETTEKRKDAQLFREIELSLYHNLSLEENERILKKFVQKNFLKKGMIADVCIHDSGGKSSNQNLHAHIMLTMRDFDLEKCTFGKKNRTWNDLSLVEEWRKNWTEISNKALSKANQNTVEHKSFQRLAEEAILQGKFDLAGAYVELEKNKARHYTTAKKTKSQASISLVKRSEKISKGMSKAEKPVRHVKLKFLEINESKIYPGNFYKNKEKIQEIRRKLAENREKIYSKIKEITDGYLTLTKFITGISRRNAERTKQRKQNLSNTLRRIAEGNRIFNTRTKETSLPVRPTTENQSTLQRQSQINSKRFKPR